MSKFKDILTKEVKKVVDRVRSTKALQKIADSLVDEMYKRIKSGKGSNGSALKPLSASYKKKRAKSSLHATTTPNKSNLTFTGKMLDSLETKVKKGEITIYLKGEEAKKATYVSKDRPFMELTPKEVKILEKMIKDGLSKK